MKTLFILTFLLLSSLNCSLAGQLETDTTFVVPAGNIIRANAIYFEQKGRIETLLKLDSLRKKQNLNLQLAHEVCKRENHINESIIFNQQEQISQYEHIVQIQKTQNRIMISLLGILFTYLIFQ